MTYHVDLAPGANPHVNYEPSMLRGLKEAAAAGKDHTPRAEGNVVRQKIDRENNFKQAGERFRAFEDWERDELISNLVSGLQPCVREIQERMVSMFAQCDADYGRRVAEGLGIAVSNGAASGASNGANDPAADSVTSPAASGATA
jgi:catalase